MSDQEYGYVNVSPVFEAWSDEDRTRENGRITSVWHDIIKNDSFLQGVRTVIELRFGAGVGGKRVSISVEPITQYLDDGNSSQSAHALLVDEPEIKNEYKCGDGTSSARSISLTVDPRFIDPASLIQSGILLSGIAEVSLQIDGANYKDRLVLIRGDISGGVAFGGRREDNTFETMDLEIVDPRETVSSRLPPFVISYGRNGLVHQTAYGERYPILVNQYSRFPCVRLTQNTNGSNTFLVCVGTEINVTEVYVNGVFKTPAHPSYSYVIEEAQDRYGVSYTQIRFTSPPATTWTDSDTVYCTAENNQQRYFSIIETISQILSQYTSFSVSGLEPSLFTEADAKVPPGLPAPRVIVNGSGSSNSATAISYIETTYCASFPMISMCFARGGYGPVVTDFRTRPVTHFVAGQHPIFDRASLVQESDKADISNQFILRYSYNPLLDIYEGVELRDSSNSALCQYSSDLFGPRESPPIESLMIHDQRLAQYVLDWMVAHKSLPSYYVEYEASPSLFLTSRRSDTITITDPEFDWFEEKATIESLTYRAGRCVVGLRVWVRFVDYDGGAYVIGNPADQPPDIQQLLAQAQQQQQQQGQNQGQQGGEQEMNVTSLNDENNQYMASASQDVIVVEHIAPFEINLPVGVAGTMITIKAGAQTGQQNPITIYPAQQQTIDGSANFVLTFSYSAITLISDGSKWLIL